MRAIVAVMLLALLAVGAWFALADGDVPPASIAGTRDDAPASAPTASPAAALAAASTALADAAVTATPEVEKRTAAVPQFTGPQGELRVVHHASKEPVPGATVSFLPPDFDWQKMPAELQELASKDYAAFERRVNLAVITDASGGCSVPLAKHGVAVTATKGDLWGTALVPREAAEPTLLALRPDRTLRLLVLDAAGKPTANSMVVAKLATAERSSWQIGATDANGRLEHPHVQRYVSEGTPPTMELVASMHGVDGGAVTVDVTAPPPEVVLRLPPGGIVAVTVRDAEGKPIDPTYLGEPTVRLAAWPEKPTDANAESQGMNRAQSGVPLDAQGVAVFNAVAYGSFVKAQASWTLRSAVVPGPTPTNPRIELAIKESADDVVLLGNLLDVDGKALVSSGFLVTCAFNNGMSSTGGRTDAVGRFRVAGGNLRAGAVTLTFDTKHASPSNPRAVELPPRELKSGRNEIGEVRLSPHETLVRGKVTGDVAPEMRRVQLQVERKRDGRWQQEWNLNPEWDADGAFTIHGGMAKGTPLRLVVQTTGFLPVPPIECSAGDTGIEIKLLQGASATATFLVDAAVPLDRLSFRFRRTEPPPARDDRADMMERMNRFMEPRQVKDGRLQREWKGLQPGRYRLQVLCSGVAAPVVAIDAVEVADGPCADPRLVDIDLRGRVRSFDIRATAADGSPIANAEAFVLIRSSGDEWSGFNLGAGVVKIAAPAAVDLIVLDKKHKAAFVDGVFDARTVALEAAPEARLVCRFPSPLPEGAQFRLQLKPSLDLSRRARIELDNGSGMMVENFFVEAAPVDSEGRVTIPVRFPGSYTVEGQLTTGARRGGIYVRDFEPRTVTLPATGDVVVQVGQKGLDRALETSRR